MKELEERELKPGLGPTMAFGPTGIGRLTGAAQHVPVDGTLALPWGHFIKMLILRHEARFVLGIAWLVIVGLLFGSYLFMGHWRSQECIEALKTSQNGTVIMSLCR